MKQTEKIEIFDWADPMFFNDQLNEEERLIRDTARDYCQEKLIPRVLEANRNEKYDREIMNEFAEMGFLGATIPEKYGYAFLKLCQGLRHQ